MKEKIGRRNFLKTAAASAVLILICRESNEKAADARDSKSKKINSENNMPLKKLGKTGAKIPILIQGTSQILNPVYDKVLHLCYREGVTAFDTALTYGWGASHYALSKFLEQTKNRKKVWLTSKSGSGSPGGILKGLDKCLKELKTDYLDLFLMHSVSDGSMVKSKFLKMGDKIRKSGKARFFGLSTHSNCANVLNEAAKAGGIDAILFRYNFRDFGDRELNLAIDSCKKAGIGLMVMKTMGSVPEDEKKVIKFKSKNFTTAQAKLKSVWEDERIDSIVSEMGSISEARENIAAAKSPVKLSSGEIHQLNLLAAKTAGLSCRGCSGICESELSRKTRISDIMRYMMYYESYGKRELARQLYNKLPNSARNFDLLEVSKAGKACPQGINIAKNLKRAKRILRT